MKTEALMAYFKEDGFWVDYDTSFIKQSDKTTNDLSQDWYERFNNNSNEALFYFGLEDKS